MRNHQRGQSLLIVLLLATATGVAGVWTMKWMSRTSRVKKHMAILLDADGLKDYIRQNVSCDLSFPTGTASVCGGSGQYLTLVSKPNSKNESYIVVGKPTFAEPFSRWGTGPWSLRAWCGPATAVDVDPPPGKVRLDIQFNRMDSDNKPMPDPMTGLLVNGNPKIENPMSPEESGWRRDLFAGEDICPVN